MTGNVDSVARKEYKIIGYVVNLASRVEQLNEQFCTKLLITQSVYEDIKDRIRGKHFSSIQVKGREEPLTFLSWRMFESVKQIRQVRFESSIYETLESIRSGSFRFVGLNEFKIKAVTW